MQRPVRFFGHALLVLCVLAAGAGASGPAYAKKNHNFDVEPTTIAELQPGDRRLSCSALTAQIDRMGDVARTGSLGGAKPQDKGLLGSAKRIGGNLAKGKVVGTLVGLTGPVGSLAINVIDGRDHDRKEALKDTARARHDRLILLYDRKGCA